MKKILLFLLSVLTVSVSYAWIPRYDEGVLLFATKYLTPQAKSAFVDYLGEEYNDDVKYLYNLEKKRVAQHTKEIHYVHLGKDLKIAEVEGDDAVTALEEALAVVRNHKSYEKAEVVKALRTAIDLMFDVHNLSHFRIEGVEHSYKDFTFYRVRWEYGSKTDQRAKYKWSTLWTSFASRHPGYSGALWVEDMQLSSGNQYDKYAKGTLREWIEHNGSISASYLDIITPECTMNLVAFNEMEYVDYEMMVKAGYRLAALLNETLK